MLGVEQGPRHKDRFEGSIQIFSSWIRQFFQVFWVSLKLFFAITGSDCPHHLWLVLYEVVSLYGARGGCERACAGFGFRRGQAAVGYEMAQAHVVAACGASARPVWSV